MRFVIVVLTCSLLIGCNREVPNESRGTPNQDIGGVKVRAPGVSVDVQKNDSGKRKVNVEVQK